MRLKLYTLSGPSTARVSTPLYVYAPIGTTFGVDQSSLDGYTIPVTIAGSSSSVVPVLAYGYTTREAAQSTLDAFMAEQGFEQILNES